MERLGGLLDVAGFDVDAPDFGVCWGAFEQFAAMPVAGVSGHVDADLRLTVTFHYDLQRDFDAIRPQLRDGPPEMTIAGASGHGSHDAAAWAAQTERTDAWQAARRNSPAAAELAAHRYHE